MVRAGFVFVVMAVALCGSANAADWSIKQATAAEKARVLALSRAGTRASTTTIGHSGGDPAQARYGQPTKRYRHGILGDAIEFGALTVKMRDGKSLRYTLPTNQVFEDIRPRLYDFEFDGKTKIITLLTDIRRGASIAVFGVREGKLSVVAQTPYIGRSNRWRNIAGIADFDGDGHLQIAEVVTPHIGGTLRFWTWKSGKLVASGQMYGFSNHFVGSRELDLSTVDDFNGDGVSDIALPGARRKNLRIVGFTGKARGRKKLVELATIPLPAHINTAIASWLTGDKATITVGLDNGRFLSFAQ